MSEASRIKRQAADRKLIEFLTEAHGDPEAVAMAACQAGLAKHLHWIDVLTRAKTIQQHREGGRGCN